MDKKELILRRGNGDRVTFSQMIELLASNIIEEPDARYELTVGSDSQNFSYTKLVEVIALHRVGSGGIFFYNIEQLQKINSIKQKITTETARSLELADGLVDDLQLKLLDSNIDLDRLDIHFQIHCDIGNNGKTRSLITEITSWVTSCGYECTIKPDSYCASGIANKISK